MVTFIMYHYYYFWKLSVSFFSMCDGVLTFFQGIIFVAMDCSKITFLLHITNNIVILSSIYFLLL
jgi:hypothetical protein